MNTKETFENLKKQKGKISYKKLDEFYKDLEPITIDEMIGRWKGGYFLTKISGLEIFLKNFILFKWYGKNFISQDKVKALVYSFLGIKFNIPFFGPAILRKMEFRGKLSASMIYNHLPIIDNFRKVDDNTIMGVMDVRGKIAMYFYLKRKK